MNPPTILKALHEELSMLNESLASLERLASGQPLRRGRPPKWMAEGSAVTAKRRGRLPGMKSNQDTKEA
jgi:hypothetical protein